MSINTLFRVRHTRACTMAPLAALVVAAALGACSDSTGSSGTPASVQIVSGDSQTAIVETALLKPLVVIVYDSNDKVVPGVTVTFITSDSGTFSPATATTDSLGQAQTTFTPGKKATSVVVSAGVPGVLSAAFNETATAAAPAADDKLSGDGQSGADGAPLSAPFVIQVLDEFGNPVVGAAVTWTSSAGSFTEADAVTDANGEAKAVLTLGNSSGAETVTAHVTGTSDVTFTATAQ